MFKTTAQAGMALVLARWTQVNWQMSVVEISHVFFVLFESKATYLHKIVWKNWCVPCDVFGNSKSVDKISHKL